MGNVIDKLMFPLPNTSQQAWDALNGTYHGVKCELKTVDYYDGNRAGALDYLVCTPSYVLDETALKTLVVCHGNGSDISTMQLWYIQLAKQLNIRVVAVEYIGYGPAKYYDSYSYMSSSITTQRIAPSEQGCYRSLELVMHEVMIHYDLATTYLLGHSLGTGVVVDYAAKFGVTNPVILISPYKSIARTQLDSVWVWGIDRFLTWYKLDKLKCPVKIFHGLRDTLINTSHSRDIYKYLPDKSLQPTYYNDGTHNNMLGLIQPADIGEVIGILSL